MSVTFIMPFRDCVTHISDKIWRACIEGMIGQTFEDWTCILIDDHSSDASAHIVRDYNDSRFIISRNDQHLGLTRSLNKAISMVKTPLTARHDSDDFSAKKRLAKQLRFLKERPEIDVIGTFARVYDPSLNPYDVQDKPLGMPKIKAAIRRENPMIHGSVVMRTDKLREVGGYDETFFVCQDYHLWSKFVLAGKKLENIPEYLYNRVSHKTCASKIYSGYRKDALRRIRSMHVGH